MLFVEYHATFRQSASYMMGREPGMETASQAGTVDEGAAGLIGSPHGAGPSVPVLVLTATEGPEVREEARRGGRRGPGQGCHLRGDPGGGEAPRRRRRGGGGGVTSCGS